MSRGVLDHIVMRNIVNNCKDSKGNVDIPRAISYARAKGYSDFSDSVKIRKYAEIKDKTTQTRFRLMRNRLYHEKLKLQEMLNNISE